MTRSFNRQSLALIALASATLLAAPMVRADEGTPGYPTPYTSSLTRAQVQADLFQARRDGSIKAWSTTYSQADNSRSIASRDQVRAELRADHAGLAGVSSAALQGEDSGSFAISRALNLQQPLNVAVVR